MSDTDFDPHPSPERLSAFSQGRASAIEASLISDHLSICRICCTQLDLLQVDDPLLTRLREAVQDSDEPREDVDRRHQALRALGRCRPPSAGEVDVLVNAHQDGWPQGDTPPMLPSVDGYEILAEVGRGGMGVVYKAHQRNLRRTVALKMILSAHLGSATGHARLRLEAELAARVQHPNIVQVHEVGSHSGGPFLGMEWVDGGNLAARVGKPWPAALAACLVKTLARAVHAAHSQGVIHRDLKPANVLLQELPAGAAVAGAVTLPGGSLVVPKVADFSLALLLEGGEHLTSTGLVLGTPAYMAPEQARGDRVQVGPGTDVYALGVMLYELLTGRLPFQADDPMRLMLAVTSDDPPSPRRLRPQVPRDLATVCLKCLEKQPADRYASAGALADDLGRFLEDKPILARRPSLLQVAARWARRHRSLCWSAALALLVAGAVLAGSVGWIVRDRAARQAWTTTEVRSALDEAHRFRKEGKWPRAQAAARRAETLLEHGVAEPALAARVQTLLRELAEQEADGQLVVELEEIRLLQAEVNAQDNRFALEKALPEYRRAFKRFGFDVKAMRPEEATALVRRRPAAVRGTLLAALDHWLDLARQEKAPEADWLERVLSVADSDVWRQRLRAARRKGDRQELEQLAREVDVATQPPQALWLLDRALQGSGAREGAVALLKRAQQVFPGDFWINHNLGEALAHSQPPQLDEAIRFYTAAVALRPESPGVYLNLGVALSNKGRLAEAVAAHRKAIELKPAYAVAHSNLGNVLEKQGNHDEACAAYRQAIKLNPKAAPAHTNLGNILVSQGKVDQAIACYRLAISLDPKLVPAHNSLGNALLSQGKVAEAIACYRLAISLNPKFAPAHNNLGLVWYEQGKPAEASACFRRALEFNPNDATCHYNLGNALDKQGKLAEASACFRRALELNPKYPEAHCNLGLVLRRQGQLAESLELLRRGHALGSKQPGWRNPSAGWVLQAERLVLLEKNLPDVLAGRLRPARAEQIEYARLAALTRRYQGAARLFAEAFAAEPKWAADLRYGHRYYAAWAAALAAAGQGKDADRLASRDKAVLRLQALTWLRADLAAWARRLDSATPADGATLQKALRYWQRDPALAGLRDATAVAGLPAGEQQACKQLWAEVQALLSNADAAEPAVTQR